MVERKSYDRFIFSENELKTALVNHLNSGIFENDQVHEGDVISIDVHKAQGEFIIFVEVTHDDR